MVHKLVLRKELIQLLFDEASGQPALRINIQIQILLSSLLAAIGCLQSTSELSTHRLTAHLLVSSNWSLHAGNDLELRVFIWVAYFRRTGSKCSAQQVHISHAQVTAL